MQGKKPSFRWILLTIVTLTAILSSGRLVAQLQVLYIFGSGHPYGLTWDAAGNLYGTTQLGSMQEDYATAFELSPKSGGGWAEKTLHVFATGAEFSGLTFDSSGNLYGTEINAGITKAGLVFKLTPMPDGHWDESVIYNFNASHVLGGYNPYGGVIADAAGDLYGSTSSGGGEDCGVVYKLSPSSAGGWTEKILYTFRIRSSGGCKPYSNLISDLAGNLYGTTDFGGTQDLGVVFELSPTASGLWKETVLHSFTISGQVVQGSNTGVVIDQAGNLYGIMGSRNGTSFGTVYELSPQVNGGWAWKVLESFPIGSPSPLCPCSNLTLDAAGNLYGSAPYGGLYGGGVIFELTPKTDGTWQTAMLHSFSGASGIQGNYPSPVVLDSSGNLYGTTSYGSTYGDGMFFVIPH